MKRSTLSLILVLSMTFVTYSHVVHAECNVNGTPGNVGGDGNDTIVCDSAPTTSTVEGVTGGAGSDMITLETGATIAVIAGDAGSYPYGLAGGANGSAAPDTIVVAGTTGMVFGDYTNDFNGADDNITVTSTGHVSMVAGDSVGAVAYNISPQVGDDTIVIDAGAVVDYGVYGDNSFEIQDSATGGNDTITVNGTVVRDVDGQVGNDNITIGGSVGGTVNGGLGDDKVILNDGANGGADNNLVVTGGEGNDTLTFAFTITSEADYNALASIIAANTPSGSISINGQTITWANFEQLVNALIANFGVGSQVTFRDNRINQDDAGASALPYCTGSGVQVWGVNPSTAQGFEAFTVSLEQIQAALAEAQTGNTNVEIATTSTQLIDAQTGNPITIAGIALAATPDGKLVVTAPDIGDTSKTYQFSFDASICGIS
jgi:hypothetical protein